MIYLVNFIFFMIDLLPAQNYYPKRQKYVQKATHAKQARGQFVRYLAKPSLEYV